MVIWHTVKEHMYDKILIATDGSEQVEPAIEHGLDLAEAMDAEVHAIYVVETEATYILTAGLGQKEMDEYEGYGKDVVTDVVKRAESRGLEGVGVVKTGSIAQKVSEYAENEDVDNVILAERGRGAIEQYLGSNAEKIVRMCKQPVTVIHSP